MSSVLSEQSSAVEFLIETCHPNDMNPMTGWGVLHTACSTGAQDVVRTLCDGGADANRLLPCGTPLHVRIQIGD